ncbi:RNA polymerase sigma factor [Actinoplanes sp. CA-015351]|uniref:RNA polymerase sigma factor n=1 Tax=Actinoplanes sp. CA-015351 TaxID=3239897 RepID=UPI003D99764E
MDPLAGAEVAARDSYGRLLALLCAATNDVAAAEDALADAFERAVRTWPEQGVPANPDAWLLAVARNRLRDWWKSAAVRRTVALDPDRDAPAYFDSLDALPDRRLELMLVCAHPAIDRAVHTPLMLNTVLGHTAEQIARAFSLPAATMATRLVRAKKRITTAGIPFRIPGREVLPDRMAAVLEAVYGAHVIDGAGAGRVPSESLHLSEVLAQLAPGDPEVRGLAALVLLSQARAGARLDDGRFVPLSDQDPALWDRGLIERAHEHLRAAHAQGRVGRFQLEAAIQAMHCAGAADPRTLLGLHRALHTLAPSLGGGVALAAVTAETDGPAAGLELLDALLSAAGAQGSRFQPARAVRAHLLTRLGRRSEAKVEYSAAITLANDPAERDYLRSLL